MFVYIKHVFFGEYQTQWMLNIFKFFQVGFCHISPLKNPFLNIFFWSLNLSLTKTSSFFKSAHPEDDSGTYFNYETGQDLAQSTSYQRISIAISNNADASCAGTLNLFNPSDTTYVKHFIANTHNEQGGGFATNNFIAGYGNTQNAVNAISFQVNTGTFDGTIQMFGIL